MNYLNIHTDTLRSEEYLGAAPVERATWLNLMAWCASQENGGVIKGASEWPDRKWLQLCGITKEEATLVSGLYQLDNQGWLTVNLYPVDKEEEVRTKREIAKANGKLGGRPKNKPTLDIFKNPDLTNVEKRKGREGKDKEKEKIKERAEKKEIERPSKEEFKKHCIAKLKEINSEWTNDRASKASELKYETYVNDKWKDGHGKEIKNWKTKAINSLKFEKPWTYGKPENLNQATKFVTAL